MWQFDTVKKYTLFVIFMGEGSKYKMEQNEDGQFDLYEQCTGTDVVAPKSTVNGISSRLSPPSLSVLTLMSMYWKLLT